MHHLFDHCSQQSAKNRDPVFSSATAGNSLTICVWVYAVSTSGQLFFCHLNSAGEAVPHKVKGKPPSRPTEPRRDGQLDTLLETCPWQPTFRPQPQQRLWPKRDSSTGLNKNLKILRAAGEGHTDSVAGLAQHSAHFWVSRTETQVRLPAPRLSAVTQPSCPSCAEPSRGIKLKEQQPPGASSTLGRFFLQLLKPVRAAVA